MFFVNYDRFTYIDFWHMIQGIFFLVFWGEEAVL
jgi:hypothetical protein